MSAPSASRMGFALVALLLGLSSACTSRDITDAPDAASSDASLPDAMFDAAPSPDAEAGPGCGPVGREACDALEPRACAPEVFIGPSGLSSRLVTRIDAVRERLDIAIYEIDAEEILAALERAAARGVAVRLLTDADREANRASLRRLNEGGVDARGGSSEFQYYHPKFLVFDGNEAYVMSANLNDYSLQSERNHGVVIRDPQDLEDLTAIFDADWEQRGVSDALRCTRLVISPTNSRQRLHALIRSAERDLSIQHLSLSDRSTRTLLVQRAAEGVSVRVLLANPEWIESNQTAAEVLREGGVEVRFQREWENHTKLIIADGERASVGSINLSYTSLERNREVSVIVSDEPAVGMLLTSFEADWTRGSSR